MIKPNIFNLRTEEEFKLFFCLFPNKDLEKHIRYNPHFIKYIKKPPAYLCWASLKSNPFCIAFIANPSRSMLKYAKRHMTDMGLYSLYLDTIKDHAEYLEEI